MPTKTKKDGISAAPKPLTPSERGKLAGNWSEAGKIGGQIGGKISRGGGRPRKYATASDRQRAYRERKRAREVEALLTGRVACCWLPNV